MYSNYILERFQNPKFAGGLRGANGTGKVGNDECGDIIKIYILVDDAGIVTSAKFKAYGGVCTIVACDEACELLIGKTLEDALRISNNDILEKMGNVPSTKEYTASLAEEAIKNAVEDYYKKKEKEERKQLENN